MTTTSPATPSSPQPPAGYGQGWGAGGPAPGRGYFGPAQGGAVPARGGAGPARGGAGPAQGGASHRPWSGILLAVHAILTVLAVAGVCVGTVAAGIDLSDRSEAFDGLLAFLGLLLAGVSLLVGAGALVLTVLTRKGRRRADAGDPGLLRGVGIAAVVLAALATLTELSWLYAGIVNQPSSLPVLVLALPPLGLYVTAAAQTMRAASRQRSGAA